MTSSPVSVSLSCRVQGSRAFLEGSEPYTCPQRLEGEAMKMEKGLGNSVLRRDGNALENVGERDGELLGVGTCNAQSKRQLLDFP